MVILGPDAPPSYNSIFGESGEDKVSFVRKVIIILMETSKFSIEFNPEGMAFFRFPFKLAI